MGFLFIFNIVEEFPSYSSQEWWRANCYKVNLKTFNESKKKGQSQLE